VEVVERLFVSELAVLAEEPDLSVVESAPVDRVWSGRLAGDVSAPDFELLEWLVPDFSEESCPVVVLDAPFDLEDFELFADFERSSVDERSCVDEFLCASLPDLPKAPSSLEDDDWALFDD